MPDAGWRALLILGVVLVAAAVAGLGRRVGAARHARIDPASLDLPSGLVVFTSTECPRCRRVLELAKQTGAPLREVTYELEPGLMERAGVDGVPLLLAIDRRGTVVRQIAGKPRCGAVRRAARAAGY